MNNSTALSKDHQEKSPQNDSSPLEAAIEQFKLVEELSPDKMRDIFSTKQVQGSPFRLLEEATFKFKDSRQTLKGCANSQLEESQAQVTPSKQPRKGTDQSKSNSTAKQDSASKRGVRASISAFDVHEGCASPRQLLNNGGSSQQNRRKQNNQVSPPTKGSPGLSMMQLSAGKKQGRGRTLNESERKKKHYEKELLRRSKKGVLVIKKEFINRQRSPPVDISPCDVLTQTFQNKRTSPLSGEVSPSYLRLESDERKINESHEIQQDGKVLQTYDKISHQLQEPKNKSVVKDGRITMQGSTKMLQALNLTQERSKIIMHALRQKSQNQNGMKEISQEKQNSKNISLHHDVPLPQASNLLNASTRQSMDSRTNLFESRISGNFALSIPQQVPRTSQISHDIDLVLPFTRNKSNKRQNSESSPSEAQHQQNPQPAQTYPMIRVMSAPREAFDDEDDFEREVSEEGTHQNVQEQDNPNSERQNEILRKQSEALKEARKKQKKAVARIQKNKVNFLSVTGTAQHLKIKHPAITPQSQNAHSKDGGQKKQAKQIDSLSISLGQKSQNHPLFSVDPALKQKFDQIINSEGLRGLLLKPIQSRKNSEREQTLIDPTVSPQQLPRTGSGSALRRMKSESLFGSHVRGESAHSNNGSQHRGIEVPKVVKGIHIDGASDAAHIMSAVQSPKSMLDVKIEQAQTPIGKENEAMIAQLIQLENLNKKKKDSSKQVQVAQLVMSGINGERRRSLLDSQQRQMQSSRVSNSLLLDDFFSKSRERLIHSGSGTPNHQNTKKLSDSTATGSQGALENKRHDLHGVIPLQLNIETSLRRGSNQTTIPNLLPSFSTFINRRSTLLSSNPATTNHHLAKQSHRLENNSNFTPDRVAATHQYYLNHIRQRRKDQQLNRSLQSKGLLLEEPHSSQGGQLLGASIPTTFKAFSPEKRNNCSAEEEQILSEKLYQLVKLSIVDEEAVRAYDAERNQAHNQ
ncbi:hypothetical protein FGO68_gene13947 [Halteria grandinella]|uniref:Uncharacterized protein n=1 Tax=Halteria grandinella TaxID=5974 RepID=A0A8J8T6S9_HALGN|nr:hypothetical protein FGO68_gene13947 [Halteria grandinella]